MVDVHSPPARKRNMEAIRHKDTKPEMLIRRGLHARGFRYRLHDNRLPGKPDLVFPKYRAAVFVHGCFWHRHDCPLFKWPATRRQFWKKKLTRNLERDAEIVEIVRSEGWRVFTIWECSLKGTGRLPVDQVLDRTERWLRSGKPAGDIREMVSREPKDAREPVPLH